MPSALLTSLRYRAVLKLTALLVALALFAGVAFAAAPGDTVVVGGLALNLRAGPGTVFPSIAEIPSGESLKVLEVFQTWIRVQRTNGQIGWVHQNYVTAAVAVPAATATLVPPTAPPVTPAGGSVAVTTPFLNLRTGPDVQYPAVAEIPKGEVLAVTSESGRWLGVRRNNGQTGWVHRAYVQAVAAPAATAAATPAPAENISLPVGAVASVNAVVNSIQLNVRSAPSSTASIVKTIDRWEGLTRRLTRGSWSKVRTVEGVEGWSYAPLLDSIVAGPVPASSFCRSGDVLAHVPQPGRLALIDPCVSISGTVSEISASSGGALTFRVALDPAFVPLLNAGNTDKLRGLMQVEVIPRDLKRVIWPAPGQRVVVTGAYVEDTATGWREIHPAWFVQAP